MPRLAALPAVPLAPSLAAIPDRSMPSWLFERIALPRIEMFHALVATTMPLRFDAIVFPSPAPVPPMELVLVYDTRMPSAVLARAVVPSAARPIRLPRTTCPVPV